MLRLRVHADLRLLLLSAGIVAVFAIQADAQYAPQPRAGSAFTSLNVAAAEDEIPPIEFGPVIEDGHEVGVEGLAGECSTCPTCPTTVCRCGCYFGGVEYLLWWRKGENLPPLVSSGPLDGTNTVLFGNGSAGDDAESGGRATLGRWLGPYRNRAIVGRYFALGTQEQRFDSTGQTNVARPFVDATPNSPALGMENALTINQPGGPDGVVQINHASDFHGGDVWYQGAWWTCGTSRVDWLIGYQTASIDENLSISHTINDGGVTINGTDLFDTSNEFHGVQLGMLMTHRDCNWTLDMLAKVGLGRMDETVTISGSETRQPPPTTTPGSLLALPTNIGRYTRDEFAAVPELGVQVRHQLNDWLDISVGYSFIYFSNALRPAAQIDRTVNGTQTSGGNLNGEARPAFTFQDGDYWVQGINFGLHGRF